MGNHTTHDSSYFDSTICYKLGRRRSNGELLGLIFSYPFITFLRLISAYDLGSAMFIGIHIYT